MAISPNDNEDPGGSQTAHDESADGVLDELAVATPKLIAEVQNLRTALAKQARGNRLIRAAMGVMAVALAVTVLAVGVMAFVLKANFVTQQDQLKTRTRVLCPLYTVLVAAVEQQPKAVSPPSDVQIKSVQAIKEGYAVLKCAELSPKPPPH